jgi:hypothetical protein
MLQANEGSMWLIANAAAQLLPFHHRQERISLRAGRRALVTPGNFSHIRRASAYLENVASDCTCSLRATRIIASS